MSDEFIDPEGVAAKRGCASLVQDISNLDVRDTIALKQQDGE
jgi:hypothetical protein